MKKGINLGLLLSPLVCYLEWGKNQSSFLFQAEYLLFFGSNHATNSFTHPLVLLPLCGQLLIVYSLFQANPNKRLTLIGLLMIAPLILMILVAGLLSLNPKIILSTIPFGVVSVLLFRYWKKL
ncbi:MAG: hypothetical protein U0Y10_10445 [Spirosomataceae bacterium]